MRDPISKVVTFSPSPSAIYFRFFAVLWRKGIREPSAVITYDVYTVRTGAACSAAGALILILICVGANGTDVKGGELSGFGVVKITKCCMVDGVSVS